MQEPRIAAFRMDENGLNSLLVRLGYCPKRKTLDVSQFKQVLTDATNQLKYFYHGNYDDPTGYLKSINLHRLSIIYFKMTWCLLEFISCLKMSSLSLPLLGQIKWDDDTDLKFPEKLDDMAFDLSQLQSKTFDVH